MESQAEEQLSYKLYFAKWRIPLEEDDYRKKDGCCLMNTK